MKEVRYNGYICGGVMFIAAIARIGLANWVGIWFPCGQVYDDALLVQYADLTKHFSAPSSDSLLKYIGYPVYLKLVSLTPFSYATVTAGLWIIAALCVFFIAKRLTEKNIFAMLAYLYTLFLPVAFDMYSGCRLYRNAVIAPFSIISLSCMGLLILLIKDNQRSLGKSIGLALLTGVSFSWCYYMKEDGIWLKACLLFALLYALIIFLVRLIRKEQLNIKAIVTALFLFVLPLAIFKGVTNYYQNTNYEAFGVSDLNTRTEGNLGEFVNSIYAIESENRTSSIWAPYDALEKAFQVSPTLQQYPELLQAVHDSPWCGGNIEENPIRGDFLTWALRTALNDTGIWQSEKQISDLFGQVDQEIQQAFEDGRLLKEKKRIQLLGSAGGRTVSEIVELLPEIGRGFQGAVLGTGYELNSVMVSDEEIQPQMELCEFAAELTNTEYLTDYSGRFNAIMATGSIGRVLLKIYQCLNVILFIGSIIIILRQIVLLFVRSDKKKYNMHGHRIPAEMAFMSMVMFGIGVVYAFGISWFSSFISNLENRFLNFYNIALPGILLLAYLLAVSSLLREIKEVKRIRRETNGQDRGIDSVL